MTFNRKLQTSSRLYLSIGAIALALQASAQIKRPIQRPILRQTIPISTLTADPAITFLVNVPAIAPQVQVFKLAAATIPTEVVNEKLVKLKAPILKATQTSMVSTLETKDLVRAYIDKQSGEAALVPDLAKLVTISKSSPNALPAVQAQGLARTLLSDTRFITHDVTELRVADKVDVFGGSASPNTDGKTSKAGEPTSVRFSVVPAQRFAGGQRVYGVGSHAAVTLANDGSVEGFLRRWKPAANFMMIKPTATQISVKNSIIQQLQGFKSPNTQITVDSIENTYYDGDKDYLQPVIRFTAKLHAVDGKTSDNHVIGYVPVGQTFEEVPNLSTPSQVRKADEPSQNVPPTLLAMNKPLSAITVGCFLNRDNTMGQMAWDFWSGLSFKLPFISPSQPFALTEYYSAYPWEVDGSLSRYYMNGVNVAYTQPHGNWWLSTTLSNNHDAWTIQGINPGFGAASGGQLATWIIDSCEVIPSMYDLSIAQGNPYAAFTPWWPVFQGLHNAIGFRTEMWLNDGMNWNLGFKLSLGVDVNTAWFQSIAACPNYNDGRTYFNTHINQTVRYGRASTIIDARNLGQSIYNVTPQSPSGQLWNFYMYN